MRKISSLILFFLLASTVQYAQNPNSITSTTQSPGYINYHEYPYWIDMMQDPEANFFETQKAFYEYWEGREIEKGSGYKPFKRWEYWMSRRVSETGVKPSPHKNIEAIFQLRSSENSALQNFDENNIDPGSRTTTGNWSSLGPVNVPSGNNGYRGLGRVNAIAFHPTNANTVFIGAPSGGLWITYDNGNNWITNTDNLVTLGVSAIVIDYNNPSVVYIGTGDRDAGDAPGNGVWKSFDGGITFESSNTGMGNATVSKLIQHPSDPNMLIAATNTGIWRTVNGGLSWTRTYSANFKDVVFKPNDPQIVYASAAGLFYRSTNNGISFTQTSTGLGSLAYRGAIAVTPANPEIVYLVVTTTTSFYGLVRSTDAGLTFTTRSTTPNIMSWDCNGGSGGQAWYDLDIAADPGNANIIYCGGVNCFKSTNGGSSWAINSHWYGGCGVPSVHADLHVLEYNPLNGRLYAGNDGGVYWTANGGTSWNEISNGLIISQAYAIGQSATSRNLVINGYQDNGTSTYTGNLWVNVNGGDGMECAFDPMNSAYSYSTLYYGVITRHFNHNDQGDIAGENINGINEDGGWVTPFVIDHNDGNIMLIGYDNVWRSNNIKASSTGSVNWSKISNFNLEDLDEMAQSYANTNILYVSESNILYRSDNIKATSPSWSNLTSSLPSNNYITAIETHPTNENIVYLAMQNNVYMSVNKGASWTQITGTLPNIQVHTLVCDHSSTTDGIYAGTDIGVYYRDNENTSWIRFSEGLPYAVWVTDLEIYYDDINPDNNVLRAGTYGRGLWESPLYSTGAILPGPAGPITGLSDVCQGQNSVIYSIPSIPNATSYQWTLPPGASGSSNTNSIQVSFGTNAVSGSISVYGINDNGNGDPASLPITVNPLPGPAGAISGLQTVCPGSTNIEYSVNAIPNATSYSWSLPAGVTGTSNTNTITVTFGANATSGSISVFATNSCGSGSSSSLSITVNSLPGNASEINGDANVCQGEAGIIYTTPSIAGATSYNWVLPEGATGTSTTNTISVNYGGSAQSGAIYVNGINTCGAGQASSLNITVNTLPSDAGVITGDDIVCQGENDVQYSIPEINNASSYTWTLPPGATGSGSTNTINVDFGTNAQSGNITVSGNNECGTGQSSTKVITVNQQPGDAGNIAGTQTVCQSQTNVVYTVPVIDNATSYNWNLPPGASGSSTTNSITVNFNNSATSGNISVRGVNSCGTGDIASLWINVSALPSNAGNINGTQTVCQGQTNVIYTVSPIANATSYHWSLPFGATGTSNTNSISVNFGLTALSGPIIVKGVNNCGDGQSSSIMVSVNQKPPTPSVTLNDNILHSSATSGNQWYDASGLIEGAVYQDYEVIETGDYYTIVTNEGCSSEPSNTVHVTITSITDIEGTGISVFPNPFNHELIIENKGLKPGTHYEILNSAGQIVFYGDLQTRVVLSTAVFPKGIYLLKINTEQTLIRKLIKMD